MGILSGVEFKPALESQMELLALESEALANVIETFRSIVPNLLNNLKEKIAGFSNDEDLPKHIAQLNSEYKDLNKKLPQISYASVNQMLVSVPENFLGNFLDYAEFLNKNASELYSNANNVLTDYHSTLAVFLSNSSSQTSLQDYSNIYRTVKKTREELIDKFKVYFPKDTGLSKQRLATVLHRFADLDKLIKEVINLEKVQNKQSLTTFKTSIDQCVELLDLVIKRTEEKSVDKVSGAAAKNIADGAYELAKFIELVALFRFKVKQFISSFENTVTELNSKLA